METISIDINDVAKESNTTMEVKIIATGIKQYKIRLFIARLLIRLAAKAIFFKADIKTE